MPRRIDEKNGFATSTRMNPIAPVRERGLAEVAGAVVGPVAERGDGLLDTADEDVADAAFAVDDPRDGLEADAGSQGDVAHGGSSVGCVADIVPPSLACRCAVRIDGDELSAR